MIDKHADAARLSRERLAALDTAPGETRTPDELEWMRVALRGRDYRVIYRSWPDRASCVVELLTPDGWEERYGTGVGEHEYRFARGLAWLQRDAHANGTPRPLGADDDPRTVDCTATAARYPVLRLSEDVRATLLASLREFAAPGDPEYNHRSADEALLEYINDPEITAAFEAIDKWYA